MKRILFCLLFAVSVIAQSTTVDVSANYATLKSKNLVTMTRDVVPGAVLVTVTTYDQFGNQSSTITSVLISNIQSRRATLAAQVAALDTYITDLQAAK